MRAVTLFITLALSLSLYQVAARESSLLGAIDNILRDKRALVGVYACPIDGSDTVSANASAHLPMQSVFKFHIALAVLDQIDKGKFTLDQKIKLTKSDLLPDTWSPIRDKYPDAGVSLTVAQLIEYTVAQSDNNGCDILLRLIGGTDAVTRYLRNIGVSDVQIIADEQQMHKEWSVQYQNWTTPKSAVWLLMQFYAGRAVSAQSRDFLYAIMVKTTPGAKRLKGLLPKGAKVAHKTGSSGTNSQGITAATNDIGIVTLPNGSAYAIAVFVCDSKEDSMTNESIIAQISKAVWQYYQRVQ